MHDLEQFGIQHPRGTLSSHVSFSSLTPDEFRVAADSALQDLTPIVLRDVVPHLEDFPSRLHSSGFRVRLLGSHPTLGDLRWHEYCPGVADLREPWGVGVIDTDRNGWPIFDAGIHDHAWGVASRVIYADRTTDGRLGGYSDRVYRVSTEEPVGLAEDVSGTNGLFRVFEARYTPGKSVALETDGTIARAEQIRDRRFEVGEGHFIPPGDQPGEVWHVPTTPGGLVVTLCFNSLRMQEDGPHVLIAGPETSYTTERRTISGRETEETKAKVLRSVFGCGARSSRSGKVGIVNHVWS